MGNIGFRAKEDKRNIKFRTSLELQWKKLTSIPQEHLRNNPEIITQLILDFNDFTFMENDSELQVFVNLIELTAAANKIPLIPNSLSKVIQFLNKRFDFKLSNLA